MKLRNIILPAIVAVMLMACDDPKNSTPQDTFDQKALLTQWVDSVYLPNFEQAESKALQLKNKLDNYIADPNNNDFNEVKSAFTLAWINFQGVAFIDFGPSGDQMLNNKLAIFPTDSAQIESNIASGNYDFASASNIDAKGYAALGYLFYGPKWQLCLDTANTNRISYVKALVNDIHTNLSTAHTEWKNYRTTYIENTGLDVGSSLGQTINGYLNYFERTHRMARFGYPGGQIVGVSASPRRVEAYFSKLSLTLASQCNKHITTFFKGSAGQGLDDYLNAINATDSDGKPLSNAILAQLGTAQTAIDNLNANTSLRQAIEANPQNSLDIYNELQELVILKKIDMVSAMGIQITYADNDGD